VLLDQPPPPPIVHCWLRAGQRVLRPMRTTSWGPRSFASVGSRTSTRRPANRSSFATRSEQAESAAPRRAYVWFHLLVRRGPTRYVTLRLYGRVVARLVIRSVS